MQVTNKFNGALAITPNDSTDLASGATKGLYVGGAGNVKVTMANNDVVTFTAISVGVILPLSVKRVWATGTTATVMLAMY